MAVAVAVAVISLFRDRDFGGDQLTLRGDVFDLKTVGFNDVISSVIVRSGTWTLFADKNFKGVSVTVSAHGGLNSDGRYSVPDSLGGRNDAFSSVKVNSDVG